jgi:NitT/TauT family transport system substrate-binding protein
LSGIADTMGATTVTMPCATRRFYDINPQLSASFVAALDEAADFIADNKREAARIYIERAQHKPAESEMLRTLDNQVVRYSITPVGMMTRANFMGRFGPLETRPASWKDMFFPTAHELPGS